MKTHLSRILPLWQACDILGQDRVRRIVSCLLHLRQPPTPGTPSKSGGANGNDATEAAAAASFTKNQEDVDSLVEALFYRGEHAEVSSFAKTYSPVPPHITQAWKLWATSRNLVLDKATFLRFLVPAVVQPHAGPQGHMGLFDCWVYAVQGHAVASVSPSPSSPSAFYGSNNSIANAQTILIPDVLIFLAVSKWYQDWRIKSNSAVHQTEQDNEHYYSEYDEDNYDINPIGKEKVVWTMALLAYRVYDSYQKKGVVARDTVHRFLTDVYGEESYKEPAAKALLDAVFLPQHSPLENEANATSWLHTTVTELEFCRRIVDSIPPKSDTPFVLLDWMAVLACNMIPPAALPPSVNAFLETMNSRRRSLCEIYDLADIRLYEVKRRFHSLVQSSSPSVIQGDPMNSSEDDQHHVGAAVAVPNNNTPVIAPKQVITQAAFVKAVFEANDEMGNGGFLPINIAELIFKAGVCCSGDGSHTSTSYTGVDNDDDGRPCRWTLYHVLRFGCLAVRGRAVSPTDPDTPLLRFLFELFQMANSTANGDSSLHNSKYANENKNVLTRAQVTQMLVLLFELADFRRAADASVSPEVIDPGDPPKVSPSIYQDKESDQLLVDVQIASFLGLLPLNLKKERLVQKSINGKATSMIPMTDLVDHVLKESAAPDELTFDEFCKWQKTKSSANVPATARPPRLAQLMTELRLVAAVLFGVPPTDAAMELRLIGEIESRHKERYTQTDVSRRGPRGTVWYLIDAVWLQKWGALVKKSSKRENAKAAAMLSSDNIRLRDSIRDAAKEIGPINNAVLMADDGSLSLRPDVRWKHDYEILPPLAWSALQAWYDGGPPIYRTVVRYITTNSPSPHSSYQTNGPRLPTENELELYPFFVTVYLCDATSAGEARPFQQNYQVSRVSPVMAMLIQLCKELDVEPSMARLWVMENDPSASPATTSSNPAATPTKGSLASEDWVLSLDHNLIEQRKRRGTTTESRGLIILLELKDPESGLWPRGADGKEWSFREKPRVRVDSDMGDGIVGLYNMGNTCYLNSSIQCISHTPIFREYFTSKSYLRDINTTNPLGHEGRLAQVSAVLINSIWKKLGQQTHQPKRVNAPGSYALVTAPSLTPKTFKESLGKFNEHFSGNEQHDAQELLAFLLGGLSEDLNRIVEKPYIEAPDSDGRPDRELADIWWSNHLQRELSIIVALFTGQYKSLLTCRTCKYESARFEPFSFLQLPLPEDDHLSVTLILYPLKEGQDTMKYCVRVKSDGNLRDVLLALAKVLCDDEGEGQRINESTTKLNSSKEEESKEVEKVYRDRARNLAVVDMREGYISKIAPNSWALLDLQNKETADLPIFHVHELEPLSKATDDENKNTDQVAGEDNEDVKPKYGFLAVAQRRTELISPDFLHPFAHKLFGTPLLLRFEHMEKLRGRALYDIVAKRLRNFVPKAALRFLYVSADPSNSMVENHELDVSGEQRCDVNEGKEYQGRQSSSSRTTTDMEEVSAGPVPRYGFRLRLTSRDGRRCLTCPWYECCIGCLIQDNDSPAAVIDGDSVVVDWHFAVDLATSGFGTRSNPSDPISNQPLTMKAKAFSVPIKSHTTCAAGAKRSGNGGAITLEDCLDAFAKEERIPEAYCSKCKDFRVQTKRMSLWRLPPVVIIQLKRFQFTQAMRRKLRELVLFPVEGLDLSRIMAPDSMEKHDNTRTLSENGTDNTKVVDESETRDIKDDGRAEMLYDLYAVVHHQGALSGGHYVASLKSEIDGQWRLFNDAQIYEIHARDVVDASAYILFYVRRDAAKGRLEDFWNTRGEGEGVSEEDLEKMVKGRSDRCVIS